MDIYLNGEIRRTAGARTVAELLAELGVEACNVAVVVNDAVVPRGDQERAAIAENDRVELLVFAGGG